MEKILNRETLETLLEFQEKAAKIKFAELTEFLLKEIVETLKIGRCSFFKVSCDLKKACLVAGKPEYGHGLGMNFSFDELKAIKKVVEAGKYQLIKDPIVNELTVASRALIHDKHINAILFAPFIVREEVIGIVVLDAVDATFNEEEIDFCLKMINFTSLLWQRDIIWKEIIDEIAHKFRNPVTAIVGFAKRLAKMPDSSHHKEILAVTEEAEKLEENFRSFPGS